MSQDDRSSNGKPPLEAESLHEQIQRALAGRSFETMEEMQAAVDAEMRKINRRPLDDFQGLSPEQMQRLITAPFDSSDLVEFAEGVDERPPATAAVLFDVIAEAAAGPGLKLTAKGNLPRRIVTAADQLLEQTGLERAWVPGAVRNEADFGELHAIKVVADLGRFTHKHHGRLKLTRATQRLWERGDWARLFRALLYSYCREFNWGYRDGFADLQIIQDAFAFSLYLFHLFGGEWRPVSFYQERFLQAFPDAVNELSSQVLPFETPRGYVARAWALRTVERFACLFGMVEWEVEADQNRIAALGNGTYYVRKTPFFDQAVQWRIG